MVIAPIAPFRLSSRPVVIPFNSQVKITLLASTPNKQEKEARCVIDGQHGYVMAAGSHVTIKRSFRKARFIRFNGGFYERVRTKLTR
jgi:NAD+ kinase